MNLLLCYLQASNHNLEEALGLLTDRQDHNASYKVHTVYGHVKISNISREVFPFGFIEINSSMDNVQI